MYLLIIRVSNSNLIKYFLKKESFLKIVKKSLKKVKYEGTDS